MVCESCGSLIKLFDDRCSICGGEPSLNNKIKEYVNSDTCICIGDEYSSQEVIKKIDIDEKYNMHFFESDNWESVDREAINIVNLEDVSEEIYEKEVIEEFKTNEYVDTIEIKGESDNNVSSYEYYELLETKEEELKNRKIEELYWENNKKNNNYLIEIDEDIKNFNPEKIRREQEESKVKHRNDKKINTSLNIYFYVTVGVLLILMLAIDEILEVRGKFVAKPVLIFGLILEFLVVQVKDSIIKDKMLNAYLYLILSFMISFIIIYFVVKLIVDIRAFI